MEKVYSIKINGVQESINAIESLKKQLDSLDEKIKELEKRQINIQGKVDVVENVVSSARSTASSNSGSRTSTLKEEVALQKELNSIKNEGTKLEAKQVAYQDESYQKLLAQKDVLKAIEGIQKSTAAEERLQANNYNENTMQGIKAKLADTKALMQTTDITTEKFKELTQQANELNSKLKTMEEATGVFNRNVGNYQSAADGFNKIKIAIGNTTREFASAREASRTLNNELKIMAVNGQQDTEAFKELRQKVLELESTMNDAKKPMDSLMDGFQSFAAIASSSKGFGAVFGFDGSEIDNSIKKLLALQTAMKGIETIQKQIQTREGIGKVIAISTAAIDNATKKLQVYNRALAIYNKGMLGALASSKAAATGINILGKALKGLASLGIVAVLSAAVYAIEKAVDAIKDWVHGDADLIESSDLTTAAIDRQNEKLDKNIDLIEKRAAAGSISKQEALIQKEKEYAKALEEVNKALKEREDSYRQANIVQPNKTDLYLSNSIGDKGVTSLGGFDKEIKSINEFAERWDYLSTRVENNLDVTNSWKDTADDARDELVHLSKLVGGDMVNAFYKFSNGTKEGAKALVDYIDKMDVLTKGKYTKALKLGIDKGYLDGQFKQAYDIYIKWKGDIENDKIQLQISVEGRIENMLNQLDPTRELKQQLAEAKRYAEEFSGTWLPEQAAKFNTYITNLEKQIKNGGKKINSTISNNLNNRKKNIEDADKELTRLRISNLKDGLNKTLIQIEEERKQTLAKYKWNSDQYKEINQIYDNRVIEAKRKWAEDVERVYREMWAKINDINARNARINADTIALNSSNTLDETIKNAGKGSKPKYSDYTVNTSNISKKAQKTANLVPSGILDIDSEEVEKNVKKYLGLLEEVEVAESNLNKEMTDTGRKSLDSWLNLKEKKEALQEWLDANKLTAKELEETQTYEALMERNYATSLANQYQVMINDRDTYYLEIEKAQKEHNKRILDSESKLVKDEKELEISRLDSEAFDYMTKSYQEEEKAVQLINKQKEETEEQFQKRIQGIRDQYENLRVKAQETYEKAVQAIKDNSNAELKRLELEREDADRQATTEYFNNKIQEYRDFATRLQQQQASQPILDNGGWGIVRTSETRKQQRDLLNSYRSLAIDIVGEKEALQEKLNNNEITFDDFKQSQRELNVLQESVANAANTIQNNLKTVGLGLDNTFGQLLQSINSYVQTGLQSVQTIMQAFNSMQDAEFDKQQEALDKENEMLEKKLDEQDEIIEQHKNNIDSIEDELGNSRGERRQHLIDQLNAEMEKQREAQKEEQRLQKKKEANERKQEALDKQRKKAEYKRNLLSILVSTAMAAANGYATKPFVPVGLAMGTLALALGAVQYAAAEKAKPYAQGGKLDGGVAVGPRHRDGGIKVLGGRSEIEGGEFITNRISTQYNTPLLEFINSKKKRVDVSDMIDFYSSGKVKKNIASLRAKYEDGGYIPTLPTLRTDIDFTDRLISAFEDYSNRPQVVQVVDIINKTEDVKKVQVLAGLSE